MDLAAKMALWMDKNALDGSSEDDPVETEVLRDVKADGVRPTEENEFGEPRLTLASLLGALMPLVPVGLISRPLFLDSLFLDSLYPIHEPH